MEQRVGGRRDRFIIRTIAVVVILAGILVSYGWIANVPVLTSLAPSMAVMKFISAICFILSGLALFELTLLLDANPGAALTTLPLIAFSILLLITGPATVLLSGTGEFSAQSLLSTESSLVNSTLLSGIPSYASILCFVAVAIASLLASYNTSWIFRVSRWVGALISVLGGTVLIGYLTRIPLLQSYIPGVSKAMSFYSALLFCLLGGALLLLSRGFEAHVNESIPMQ